MADGLHTTIELIGTKEALRALNSIDKEARKQVNRDFKEIVDPVIKAAKAATPTNPPLSGMKYRWRAGSNRYEIFPWNNGKSDRGIKPFVSARKPRERNGNMTDLATFGIRWTTPDAVVLEFAGRGTSTNPKGQQMANALNDKYGQPGRILWRSFTRYEKEVVYRTERLIRQVMDRVQRSV